MYSLTTKTPLESLALLFLFTFIWPHTAYADLAKATVSNVITKKIEIASNGQEYTIANPNNLALALAADVHVQIDAEFSGRVRSWSTWLQIHSLVNPNRFDVRFKDYKKYTSYPAGHRPKTVNRTEHLSIPQSAYEDLFIAQCNILANDLRSQGLSNKQIFSQNRIIPIDVHALLETDISGLGTHFVGPEPHDKRVDIVCKKWQGAAIPTTSGGLVAEETIYVVTQSSLTILPQSTLGGACNVTLSGVMQTLKPNAPVSFKYRHMDGHNGVIKDSQIYHVTTDLAKTAMFSHQFDIPHKEGKDEHGTIQIIGLSPEFNTKKKLYELSCGKPGVSAVTTNLGPQAEMYYLIQERANFGNQSCPIKVRFVGTVKTNGARQGKAIFVGNQYLSPAFNFDLAEQAQQQFIADRTINWDLDTGTQQGASHFAHGNTGGQAFRFKDIRVGFNVSTRKATPQGTTGPQSQLATPANEQYTLAAQSKQHQIRLQCERIAQGQQSLSLSGKAPEAKPSHSIQLEKATVSDIRAEQLNNRNVSKANVLQSNAKADIVIRALNIAGNTFNKAGMITLNAKDAIRYENGRCLFDLTYSLENKGPVSTTPFKYYLTQEGSLINQHQNITLKAGEFDSFFKTIGLRSGSNTLTLSADVDKKVIESNESNNQLTKRYNVIGRCQNDKKPILKQPSNNNATPNNRAILLKPAIQR
jgi:hypothetical protein